MSQSMISVKVLFTLSIISTISVSSQNYDFYAGKSGSCPPPLPVQTCDRACLFDAHCQGIEKCCSTTCGGSTCSRPVTTRPMQQPVKSGSCPAIPTGRWVCSPTCITDGDCPGAKKCCKNRCGALACQKPTVEIIKSVEVPIETLQPNDIPTDTYNINPNNPFLFNNN